MQIKADSMQPRSIKVLDKDGNDIMDKLHVKKIQINMNATDLTIAELTCYVDRIDLKGLDLILINEKGEMFTEFSDKRD